MPASCDNSLAPVKMQWQLFDDDARNTYLFNIHYLGVFVKPVYLASQGQSLH